MNAPLLTFTHLCAAGSGLLAALISKRQPATTIHGRQDVTNKFVSLLDHIGDGLKKFFTSPIAEDVEADGIGIAEAVWPGLTPMLSAVQASIVKAQALAASANVTGDTTAQATALVLSDAQQAFTAYEQASGTTLETAQQKTIIQLVLQLLANLPAPTSTAPAAAVAAAKPVAAAPAPQLVTAAPVAAAEPAPAVAAAQPETSGLAPA